MSGSEVRVSVAMVMVGGRVSVPRCFEGTLTITNTFEMHKKQLCLCGGGQSASSDPRKYLNQLKIHSIE